MLIDFKRADNSIISFMETSGQPSGRRRVSPHILAIIKQSYDETTGETMPNGFDPATGQTQDTPADGWSKGHTILIDESWFVYMQKIMTPAAYRLWRNIGGQLFNHEDGNKMENVSLPNNFIAFDYIGATHARMVCRYSLQAPSALNPLDDNWFDDPTSFWMSTMVNKFGDVLLMGNGDYVFTPVVKRAPERYIPLSKVELFHTLPFDTVYENVTEHVTGYCLEGTDVWGHAETRDIPLRLVGQDRIARHPCAGWMLETKPVIPLPL